MEYESLVCMGTAESHLDKLDKVQESAMKLCGFEIGSFESRREAAAVELENVYLSTRADFCFFRTSPC